MVSRYAYFTLEKNKYLLTSDGARRLGEIINGRPQNSWRADRIQEGNLRTKLQKEILNMSNLIRRDLGNSNLKMADHHILPGNMINTILKGALKKEGSLATLNNYLTSRLGIPDMLATQLSITYPNEQNALQFVFSSVFWFQFNLVLGPKQQFRLFDPDNNLDYALHEQQLSSETKIIYNELQAYYQQGDYLNALKKFLSLKKINNVKWGWKTSGYFPIGPNKDMLGVYGYAYDSFRYP